MLRFAQICAFLGILCGCWPQSEQNKNGLASIRIGVISGPESHFMTAIGRLARSEHHLNIEIVAYNDYLTPNFALEKREIDAQCFGSKLYLDKFLAVRKSGLIPVTATFVFPMAGYSSKIKSLADLLPYSNVAIPDDPANQGRALLLMAKEGIIKLAQGVGLLAGVSDIVSNPKRLRFTEMDGSQLCRAINDVDLVLLTATQAATVRLFPLKDAIFLEDVYSPYANVLVIREEDKNKPWVKPLIAMLRSNYALKAAKDSYKDTIIRSEMVLTFWGGKISDIDNAF